MAAILFGLSMPSLDQELAKVAFRNEPLSTHLEGGEVALLDPPQNGLRVLAKVVCDLADPQVMIEPRLPVGS